jgi:hypothetical protein
LPTSRFVKGELCDELYKLWPVFSPFFFKFKRKVAVEIMFLLPSVRPRMCMLLSASIFLVFSFQTQALDNLDTKYIGEFPVFSHFDLLQTSFT